MWWKNWIICWIWRRREIRTVSRNSPGRTNGEPKTASEEEIDKSFLGTLRSLNRTRGR